MSALDPFYLVKEEIQDSVSVPTSHVLLFCVCVCARVLLCVRFPFHLRVLRSPYFRFAMFQFESYCFLFTERERERERDESDNSVDVLLLQEEVIMAQCAITERERERERSFSKASCGLVQGVTNLKERWLLKLRKQMHYNQ